MANANTYATACHAFLIVAACVEACPAVGLVDIGIDALIAANDESLRAITGTAYAEATGLARAADVAARPAVIRIGSGIYLALCAQFPVAIGTTGDAFAYTMYAVAKETAIVAAFAAIVVVRIDVHALVVTESIGSWARVVVVTTSGKQQR